MKFASIWEEPYGSSSSAKNMDVWGTDWLQHGWAMAGESTWVELVCHPWSFLSESSVELLGDG
jgi:hypothetical protein